MRAPLSNFVGGLYLFCRTNPGYMRWAESRSVRAHDILKAVEIEVDGLFVDTDESKVTFDSRVNVILKRWTQESLRRKSRNFSVLM
jgi:hypothetical protein